jgi:hypothetical protein
MKLLPPALQSHLDTGATTLAWCWRLTRRDGTRLGFTDHDRDLAFDGTTFAAATGFTATEIKDAVGLSVDNLEVESALSADSLNEDDLAAGLFDDAGIEIWRVNWADTAQRVLMRSGSIGEVRRSGPAFAAEVRGLAHYLQQPKGRLFQYGCDADLGDARCTVDLTASAFRGIAPTASSKPRRAPATRPPTAVSLTSSSSAWRCSLSATASRSFIGEGLKPLSPAHVRGSRSAGDLAISWVRRTRMGGDSWDAVEVPLAEEAERYEVDILDGSTVKRTLATISPSATYTASQQTADFGAPQSSISLRAYQLSTVFGRGSPANATL